MRKNKFDHLLVVALLAALPLAGCGSGGGSGAPAESSNPPVAAGVLDTTFGGDTNPADTIPDDFAVHDNAAGGNANDGGQSIALDGAGRIYITGSSENSAGNRDMVIWRYTSAGRLDPTFGAGKGFVVHDNAAGGNSDDDGLAIALDAAGRIYVTGGSTNPAGDFVMVTWRYTGAGLLDTSFGPGSGYVVSNTVNHQAGLAMVLDPAGRIYISSNSYDESSLNSELALWRYTSSGQLDPAFAGGQGLVINNEAPATGWAMALDKSGRIYLAGYRVNSGGPITVDMAIWRYSDVGTLDTAFGDQGRVIFHNEATGKDTIARAITLDSRGRIYVTGNNRYASGNIDMITWRYTDAGALDTTFGDDTSPADGVRDGFVTHHNAAGGNSDETGQSAVLDPAGRLYVSGISKNAAGNKDLVLWRLTSDGRLDPSFGGGKGFVVNSGAAGGNLEDYCGISSSIALDSSGRVYITGGSTNTANNLDMVVWRYE